jgi:hypothetical protein
VSTSASVGDVVAMRERDALLGEIRDARDLIVQLQRELERARGVIEQQRDVVRRATRLQQHGRKS